MNGIFKGLLALDICYDDPVDFVIRWQDQVNVTSRIPFICIANDKKPGGDWETGVVSVTSRAPFRDPGRARSRPGLGLAHVTSQWVVN